MNRWFWAWLVALTSLVAALLIVPSAQATVTGSLAGTVTDSTNHGVKGVVVDLIGTGGNVVASASTATSGVYQLSAPAGVYDLCFDGRNGTRGAAVGGYLSQCFGGQSWHDDPTDEISSQVTIVGGQTTGGINAALGAAAGLSGTVTASVGGAGLAGVHIEVFASSRDVYGPEASATTAANGTYSIAGIDPGQGLLTVCFNAGSATGGTSTTGYESQCWNNQPWQGTLPPDGVTPVTPTAGQVSSGIGAALVAGSSIAGRITDGASGGVAGVSVLVYSIANGQLATGLGAAVTDSTGNYTVSGLQPNAAGYDLCFDSHAGTGGASTTGYLGECYANIAWDDGNTVSNLPAGTSVPLAAGATVTGINQTLTAAGAISGTVTSGGAPLANVHVSVVGGSTGVITVSTAANGTYTVPGLYAGTNRYRVCFDPSHATGGASLGGYLGQCYNGKPWDTSLGDIPSSATPVSVTASATTNGIDASLARAGGLSGTVTSGGQPVSDATVLVYSVSTGFLATGYSTVTTATDGTYTVKGLKPAASAYRVCFDTTIASGGPSTTGYTDQCYNNSPWDGFTSPTSTKVTVTANTITPAINAGLTVGGAISGHVTSATGGTGVGNVTVFVAPVSNLGLSTGYTSAVSGADGSYSVKRLPASASGYAVCFDAARATGGGSTTGYLDQCANNQNWDGQLGDFPSGLTAAPVTSGATTTVDDQLASAGAISGKVTESGTGAPLAGVTLQLYDTGGNELPGTAKTATNGTYRINTLPAGNYVLCFDVSNATGGGPAGDVSQCYKNQAWDGFNAPPGATQVAVTNGNVTSSINAVVKQAGSISGTVTAASGGTPLPVDVTIFDNTKNYLTDVVTDNAGHFSATGITPSTKGFYACVNPYGLVTSAAPSGFLGQCYNGVTWNGQEVPTSATKIPLAAGQIATANFALAAGGGISGTVTTGTTPLAEVNVDVFDTHGNQLAGISTADDGTYEIPGLATGSYEVCFDGSAVPGAPAGYSATCWKNKAWTVNTAPNATRVAVTAGSLVTGISAKLTRAAGISGTLSDANGPVQSANVEVYDQSGTFVGQGFTEQDGTYLVPGLAPTATGDIVCFDTSGASDGTAAILLSQCYQNVYWDGTELPAGTQPVPLTAGNVQSGIDDTIASAGSITGKVTAQVGGATITKATAYLADADGNEIGSANVTASGTFTFSGIAPGTYDVCVQAKAAQTGGPFGPECYLGVSWNGSFPVTGATSVPVVSGQHVTGINVTLPPAA